MLNQLGSNMPSSEAEIAELKLELIRAGFRSDNAVPVFYGLRMVATLVMLVAVLASAQDAATTRP